MLYFRAYYGKPRLLLVPLIDGVWVRGPRTPSLERYNSGPARWERCLGQDMRKSECKSSSSKAAASPHISCCQPKLLRLLFLGFRRLHYTGMMDYIISHWWLNAISGSHAPQGWGVGLKVPALQSCSIPLAASLHIWSSTKFTSLT